MKFNLKSVHPVQLDENFHFVLQKCFMFIVLHLYIQAPGYVLFSKNSIHLFASEKKLFANT
jgi:hypothetical protein